VTEPSLPAVRLKFIDEDDLEFWEALVSQPEARQHQPLNERHLQQLRQELGCYSETDLSSPVHREYKWVVMDESTDSPVGVVSFVKLDLEQRIGRIGYTISKQFWGRGYGTSAVAELTRLIFTLSDTERIEAECSVHNPASWRVLEKNGYHLEGTKRGYLEIGGERVDHHSFGILKDDWETLIDN
tara:strand:- start:1133 stop:1687 length:555 start_codon:yes stop_codon:yes gene_type:complete